MYGYVDQNRETIPTAAIKLEFCLAPDVCVSIAAAASLSALIAAIAVGLIVIAG